MAPLSLGELPAARLPTLALLQSTVPCEHHRRPPLRERRRRLLRPVDDL